MGLIIIPRLVLTIERDPYELSPNKRLHWRERARLVKHWRLLTHYALLQELRSAPCFMEPPYTVQYAVTRKRTVDMDAVGCGNYALKAVVDELVTQHLLVGDAARYLNYAPSTLVVDRTVPPHVVVTITGKEQP